jgi:hypothetical protein
MLYQLLGDVVLLIHFAFVAFVLLGAFFALRWPRVTAIHLVAVLWAAVVEFAGWVCPLTPLENWLRRQAGGGDYRSDFIARYLFPLLYPQGLTREVQIALGILVIVVNVVAYGWVLRSRRQTRKDH